MHHAFAGSYTNGTYVRTKSATGPGGGHAVKLVGWGVDANGVDYWTIAKYANCTLQPCRAAAFCCCRCTHAPTAHHDIGISSRIDFVSGGQGTAQACRLASPERTVPPVWQLVVRSMGWPRWVLQDAAWDKRVRNRDDQCSGTAVAGRAALTESVYRFRHNTTFVSNLSCMTALK